MQENLPGRFPFTAGVFPFKRTEEDPTRMFAGEGGPEQTNRRFHYLSAGMVAIRLSTAFDSVTLYGQDPDVRPDIYGKVGNSGVPVATLDDAKKLYSGFDLLDPATSVSMTINGPAPMILAFFLNAAIDQQCQRYIVEPGLAGGVGLSTRHLDLKSMAANIDPAQVEHMVSFDSLSFDIADGSKGLTLTVIHLDSEDAASDRMELMLEEGPGLEHLAEPIGDISGFIDANEGGIGSMVVFKKGDWVVMVHTAQSNGVAPLLDVSGLETLARLVAERL